MLLAVLGDSLTYGFPFGPKVSWLTVLAEKLKLTVQNHGVCGQTTGEMKDRLPAILKEKNLSHLLIFGGANDILLDRRPLDFILADLKIMQEEALQKGLKTGCILPLIPAVALQQKDFVKLRKMIEESSNPLVKIIDLQPAFLKNEDNLNYLEDGVHLSRRGNQKLGEYAAGILAAWLQ